ncbi:hypothetical protein CCAE64S_03098 [Castellaniella caeni]
MARGNDQARHPPGYGEVREIGYAVIDDRLHCVVFTQRGDKMHVISLRKANSRGVRDYVKQT